MSEEFLFHRPISLRVVGIDHVPHVRTLPVSTMMTINHFFTREKARELIEFLEGELAQEHLEIIGVEMTGPSP